MKKLFAFVVAAVALVGCQQEKDPAESAPAPPPTVEADIASDVSEDPVVATEDQIVYRSGKDVYAMFGNGTGRRRVTRSITGRTHPAWTPAGDKIVYVCGLNICRSNADGSNEEIVLTGGTPQVAIELGKVAPFQALADPVLSPDGRQIAFSGGVSKGIGGIRTMIVDVYVYDLVTEELRAVSDTGEDDVVGNRGPTWAAGGLAWAAEFSRVVDPDDPTSLRSWAQIAFLPNGASDPVYLTDSGAFSIEPDFSPDGSRIAFAAADTRGQPLDIWAMDADGTDKTRLTQHPASDRAPSWSPDGARIVFTGKDVVSDPDTDLFTIDASGANRRRITFNAVDDAEPDWGTARPTLSFVAGVSAFEGDTGTTPLVFEARLSAPAAAQVTATVTTDGRSATEGEDFVAPATTLTFAPGETSKTVTVDVVGDTVAETAESFYVILENAQGAVLGQSKVRGLIRNDDTPPTPTPPPTATPTPTPVPGQAGGQIAYTSGVDGDYDVWIMDGSGAGKTNLTNDPSSEGSPDLSPDGRNVAFQRMIGSPAGPTPPDFQIYQVPSAGGTPSFLNGIADAFDVTPAWSPGGNALAWVSSTSGGNPDIYTATPPAGTPAQLSADADTEGYTEWGRLANGTEAIAYHVQPADPAGTWEVRLVELPSKTVRSFGEGRHPEISPDGTKLVFASNRAGGDYEIYVVTLGAPATPVPVTNNSVDDFTPSWSPDGTKIAWTSHPGGGRPDVFTMNADGSGPQNLTNSPATDDFEPSWGVKPAPSLPRETAPTAILVMVPLMGAASALAARRKRS